jgi:hypothetical protein
LVARWDYYCRVGQRREQEPTIFSSSRLRLAMARSREIYKSNSLIGRLQWLPDGDGLLMVLADPVSGLGGPNLVSFLPPCRKVQRLTNDLTNYDPCCVDLTRKANTIATIDENYVRQHLAGTGRRAADKARQITSSEAIVDASWLTNDKIVVQNTRRRSHRLWTAMEPIAPTIDARCAQRTCCSGLRRRPAYRLRVSSLGRQHLENERGRL